MLRHLPNFLTCCNLLCGVAGIVLLLEGNLPYPVAAFVWLACVFDFFDGFAARALRVSSPIGKELDSLADVVSFGVLPGVFMYTLINEQSPGSLLAYSGFLIVVFSALRLAKFNIDENQTDSFVGLPTPANALFITALPFIHFTALDFIFHPVSLVVIAVIFSWLLVSPLELFALKFKDFSWQSNKIRFTFLLLSVLLLVTFNFAGIPFIILLYILMSLGMLRIPGLRNR